MDSFDAALRRTPLIAIGRWFFGVALLGMGIEHFIFQDFVTGRAPGWPIGVPGKMAWAYGSGVIVILTGLAILVGRWGRPATLGLALLIAAGALLRHVPILVGDSLLGGSWTRAGKALAVVGGLFAVSATLPAIPGATPRAWLRFANSTDLFVLVGRICLGCFLIVAGMQHFKFTTFAASLIPSWFPGNAISLTRFAGVALIAGGLGLLVPRTAMLAGLMSGVMVFSWFWIVHLPRLHTSVSDAIAVFEALAVSGIALVLAGTLAVRRTDQGL